MSSTGREGSSEPPLPPAPSSAPHLPAPPKKRRPSPDDGDHGDPTSPSTIGSTEATPASQNDPEEPEPKKRRLSHDFDHGDLPSSQPPSPARTPRLCDTLHAEGDTEPLSVVTAWLAQGADATADGEVAETPHGLVAGWLVNHDCADSEAAKAMIRRSEPAPFDPRAATEGLLLAIDYDRVDLADFFFGCGASLVGVDHRVTPPLLRACEQGNFDFVRLLIERGADVNSQGDGGFSALYVASRQGSVEIVEYLVMKGADVNAWSPFFMACAHGNADAAVALLQHGAKVSSEEYDVLLTGAATGASIEEFQLIFQLFLKLDFNRHTSFQREAIKSGLHSAASCGELEVTRWLYYYMEIDENGTYEPERKSILEFACEGGNMHVVDFLLDQGWKKVQTGDLLRAAAEAGSVETVELLLSRESLRQLNCPALVSAVESGHTDVVRVLLDHGALADSRDEEEKTALHLACEFGYAQIVQMLLEAGADINATCADSLTPMDYASDGEYDEIVEILRGWSKATEAEGEEEN
ncbi:ankyrin repeat-containing domain protein [Zopfochytrium polystomum]|nr:ankyrin repeat-containing domain protein [Zopfochytrium polystomum]